ncbi:MAG: aminotransferase class III-fold pyridoxal phosphate-dependent enzyme [Verrucomicrobiae bacterium]|nr:aminotransferase class III-fold pyridoxal phosphate-dependent enzyme [Verrucomicrobiae bacterium]
MLPKLITSIPGPRSQALMQELHRYESPNITYFSENFPIFWERAEGTNVWDVDGNRFLDWTSGFGVASLGFQSLHLQSAIHHQSQKLWHAMGDVHPTEAKVNLCRELVKITFERWGLQGKVILGNSGFEAVEAALKTAHLATGKPGVLAFEGSYHGLGYGALDTTALPEFREPFLAQLKTFTSFVPYPTCYRCPYQCTEGYRLIGEKAPDCSEYCLEKLEEEIRNTFKKKPIGAILVEPIQGRGGVQIPPRDFLPLLRALADEYEALLIVDEIYTGFWRTGTCFACEAEQVIPDIICLGKSLTGGFPLSACVGRADLIDAWPRSTGEALHTSTFLGNPLGCAMALASLEQWQNFDLWKKQLHHLEEKLRSAFFSLKENHALLGNVRGKGALWGLELIQTDGSPDPQITSQLMVQMLNEGFIFLAGGRHHNVLTLSPPFLINEQEIQSTIRTLNTAIGGQLDHPPEK